MFDVNEVVQGNSKPLLPAVIEYPRTQSKIREDDFDSSYFDFFANVFEMIASNSSSTKNRL